LIPISKVVFFTQVHLVNDSHQAKSLDEVRAQPEKGDLREKVREPKPMTMMVNVRTTFPGDSVKSILPDFPLDPDVEARVRAGRHVRSHKTGRVMSSI
jgi:hypothetical protein